LKRGPSRARRRASDKKAGRLEKKYTTWCVGDPGLMAQ